MPLPSGATLTAPTCTRAWLDYPFKASGDAISKVYNHFMEVKAVNYTPLANDDIMTAAKEKPTNSPFADDENAFWVSDTIPEAGDGGMVFFIRTFANIPQSRQEGAGAYAFAFPGNGNTTKISAFSQGSVSVGIVSSRPEVSFTASGTNSLLLGIGDKFTLRATGSNLNKFFRATPYGGSYISTGFAPRLVVYSKVASGSNYAIKAYVEGHEGFILSSWVFISTGNFFIERITLEGRASATPINASSILDYRYIKTDNISDEKLGSSFQVIFAPATSAVPTVVDDLTATTYPSLDIYNGMVYRGAFIAAEDEIVRRWMGNIWEVVSRKVVAR
jgi:hypothetical protein